jgi:hypothetical protein
MTRKRQSKRDLDKEADELVDTVRRSPRATELLGGGSKASPGYLWGEQSDGRRYLIEIPTKCPFCARVFPPSIPAALENHIRIDHPGDSAKT